ncbi:hypothetical protein E8E11_002390 [Didymella keratinophila]|nr:hypothetical protein E8E11_002390 [Didymella keratinophila]
MSDFALRLPNEVLLVVAFLFEQSVIPHRSIQAYVTILNKHPEWVASMRTVEIREPPGTIQDLLMPYEDDEGEEGDEEDDGDRKVRVNTRYSKDLMAVLPAASHVSLNEPQDQIDRFYDIFTGEIFNQVPQNVSLAILTVSSCLLIHVFILYIQHCPNLRILNFTPDVVCCLRSSGFPGNLETLNIFGLSCNDLWHWARCYTQGYVRQGPTPLQQIHLYIPENVLKHICANDDHRKSTKYLARTSIAYRTFCATRILQSVEFDTALYPVEGYDLKLIEHPRSQETGHPLRVFWDKPISTPKSI